MTDMPQVIQEFYDKHDRILGKLELMTASHETAYMTGFAAISNDPEELDDLPGQDRMIDAMLNSYLESIVTENGLDRPTDSFEQEVILLRFRGIRQDELRAQFREKQRHYTADAHRDWANAITQRMAEKMLPLAYDHFDAAALEEIGRYLGRELDILITNAEVARLLLLHRQ